MNDDSTRPDEMERTVNTQDAATDANSLDATSYAGGQRGVPGEGAGRRDEIGASGVYPFSASANAADDAPIQSEGAWGQGERGFEGYDDSGGSETQTT